MRNSKFIWEYRVFPSPLGGEGKGEGESQIDAIDFWF
jgi:hypothetical protein